MTQSIGRITWINGPVMRAEGSRQVTMGEMVELGEEHLVGEVIGLKGNTMTIQVYEETSGISPGMAVYGTGLPLSVELAPGLIRGIFDGIQRPLTVMERFKGSFIGRGIQLTPLYRGTKWSFTPILEKGTHVFGGSVLGTVPETPMILHKVMVPPWISGTILDIATKGEYSIEEPIAVIKTESGEQSISMLRRWPVRTPRPVKARLEKNVPLMTGQRILDTFFPLVKGGTAAIPGGFGTGKTITQHQVAKWSDADVVVYVGCGERGNEMTEVLQDFPALIDPRSGQPLMDRTVLIANTSNMQVAARDASIYTAVTIAEYYRDMGYHVAVMADSTSRWAEAMREISGRLEEMPAQEGYPAYLSTRLAEFYERAGLVRNLDGSIGSVSIIGAVSPPGGDFSEPVTQQTKQFTRVFWALDKSLASARHFPSVNWLNSYSEYLENVTKWWEDETGLPWRAYRTKAMEILNEEGHLDQIVKLVGQDALPDYQRVILETARLLREGFLQQNAMDQIDTYSTPQKQIKMLELILHFHERATSVVSHGAIIKAIQDLPVITSIIRMKSTISNANVDQIDEIRSQLDQQMDELEGLYNG
jgi:V/A-type H+-transporting ATPase subunit A